jgi:dihydrofolate reductase
LDGYIAAADGDIGWSAPDAELHRFHNQRMRDVGVQLCGRRLYETMLYWEAPEERFTAPEALEFAQIWKPIPKIVFSTTLERVQGNATLARERVEDVATRLREELGKDVAVGGAGLASKLIEMDLIDDYRLFISPVVLGGGTRYFAASERRIDLELVETRTFASRVVYVRYRRA